MQEAPRIRLVGEPSPGDPATGGLAGGGYVPGTCNIGPDEIEARMRGGHAALAVSAALLGGLLAVRAPAPARMLVALPVAGAASGYLQARLHFCAGFGSRGLYNFGPLGDEHHVADPAARAADRRTSFRIGLASVGIGLTAGLAATLLPLRTSPRQGT